ncbi:helix-turn-helix transcriptional regulator [Accumulibacter sp.]|uniref:helix-turn-helix domain-containing protein n=1 Tax=Accumulibacter sp. TaxID=2053492 RepID=UPI0025F284FE|nr:helix-turn-helix transcriptional regulator [Accumulibacter sp.]MCM8596699.1 helix-turn-helix domain-containing protein [Accumulibacter sp.]MCM8624767.1 helix-turn-helix domain-containing protein [Accumulibacter sp.]MDS4050847.1 helix-turn-helix transcriptional regulator [Accumulibacter sp.]
MAGRLLDISSATVVAGKALETAGRVTRALQEGHPIDAASEVVRAVLPGVGDTAAWVKTGEMVRAMRETAGLTIAEVGAAIDLKDPSLIEAIEQGRLALSFEVILRLAAVFGRNDPVGFVMRLTRTSNPELWKSLEALGVGKLVLQTVREHQFVNVYRSHDEARSLSDEEFAEILSFTKAAFEMAMALRARHRAAAGGAAPSAGT